MTGLTSLTAQVGQSGSLPPRGAIVGPFLWGQAGSATGGAGPMQGRGSRLWAVGSGGPRALIPSSCRSPQIDSLLTFFSAAGSAAQIDGAASPLPSELPLPAAH